MNYLALLIASFLSAFGMGYLKFYGVSYMCDHTYTVQDKEWVIQLIGAILTFGPVAIYFVSAPLAASIKKAKVMSASAFVTGLILLFGYMNGWVGTMWLYLFLSGLMIGIFSVAKMSCVPIQAEASKYSVTSVNAGMSILFVVGLIVGAAMGTSIYSNYNQYAAWTIIAAFFFATLSSLFCIYTHEKLEKFSTAQKELFTDTVKLLFKYPLHLSGSPLIWGIAGALTLAVTAYIEIAGVASATKSSFILLYAAFGSILGNLLSMKIKKDAMRWCLIFVVLLTISIPLFPVLVNLTLSAGLAKDTIYIIVAFKMGLMGVFFGCATNIIDAEYLKKIGDINKEACGAALQSFMISLFTLLIGSLLGLLIYKQVLDSVTQFFILSILTVAAFTLTAILAIRNGFFHQVIINTCLILLKLSIKLRYKINVKGMESLDTTSKGTLFLPNHPAEIDPVILSALLLKKHHPSPVVLEDFYYMPVVNSVFKLIKAIPMPNMDKGAGLYKQLRINQKVEAIGERLQNNQNILMYPAGRLMRSGSEDLGASSGVKRILEIYPKTQIVLVRTKGLWGSSFSTAQTGGHTPELLGAFKGAIKMLFANVLFFTPRRRLEIECQTLKTSLLNKEARDINRELESFYNHDGSEPLNLVSRKFWKNDLPVIEDQSKNDENTLTNIPKETQRTIMENFAKQFKLEDQNLSTSSNLTSHLGMDSLLKADVLMWLEEEYDMSDIELNELNTMADVITFASGQVENKGQQTTETLTEWLESNRPNTLEIGSSTLAEAFLKAADTYKNNLAIADEISGILSWKKLKLAVMVLSAAIKKFPEQNIGIMLPASNAATITLLSTILAGKTPVMLNWTVGKKNLEHAVNSAEIKRVLTSSTFLDKLMVSDFGFVDQMFYALEDLKREEIGMAEKIAGLLNARKNASTLLKDLELENIDPHSPAVILFTSGSEAAPKGVPLSHHNILSNIKDAQKANHFSNSDILYGFLPPFHSFGLTVTTFLPLFTGMKVVFHPNPTESRKIARGVLKYGVTYLCSTPTFLNAILNSAPKENFNTVHTYICGAEKCPQSLRDMVDSLESNAAVLEGYGITECSPVLSMNRKSDVIEGVGKVFDSIDITIVHPETMETLNQGESGLICVKGPSIFNGYLNIDNNPFVDLNNSKYYNTGDLGYLSSNNNLVLSGRMKRFIKVAGEMISLPAMEDALVQKWPNSEEGPCVALDAKEVEGQRPEITLFTTLDITREMSMTEIKGAGFSNLAKISSVVKIDEMPILGTGKTDYQTLKKQFV